MKSESNPPPAAPQFRLPPEFTQLIRRHLLFGWGSLLFFLTLGIALEALHGFKAGMYLGVSKEMRRLMWTLAHAHGTLLALVHIAFAVTLPHVAAGAAARRALASRCLMAASLLLPGGFFLGGLFLYGDDPGLGIVLVPIGALLLFASVFLTIQALRQRKASEISPGAGGSSDAKPAGKAGR